MRFYCFVASVIALTGLADAYNLAQTDARPEEAIFEDTLAETYVEQDGTAAADPAPTAGATPTNPAGNRSAAGADPAPAAGADPAPAAGAGAAAADPAPAAGAGDGTAAAGDGTAAAGDGSGDKVVE